MLLQSLWSLKVKTIKYNPQISQIAWQFASVESLKQFESDGKDGWSPAETGDNSSVWISCATSGVSDTLSSIRMAQSLASSRIFEPFWIPFTFPFHSFDPLGADLPVWGAEGRFPCALPGCSELQLPLVLGCCCLGLFWAASVERSCGRISIVLLPIAVKHLGWFALNFSASGRPCRLLSKLLPWPLTRASNTDDSVRCSRFRGTLRWFWRQTCRWYLTNTGSGSFDPLLSPWRDNTFSFPCLIACQVNRPGHLRWMYLIWSTSGKDLRRLISGCCGSQSLMYFPLVSVSNGSWAVWTWGLSCCPPNSNGWSSSSAPRAPSPSASAVALYHNNRGLSLKGTRVVFFFLSPQQEGLPQWQGPLPNPYASVQVQGKPLWPSNRRFHLRFDPRSQVYMVINLSWQSRIEW